MNKTFNYAFALTLISIFSNNFAAFDVQNTNGQIGSTNDHNIINNIYKNNQNGFSDLSSQYAIGIVRDGTFILVDINETRSLTSTGIVEATTPENGLVNLGGYEGKAILVSYQQLDSEWLWGANIVEVGGPLITELIKKIFDMQ